MRRDRHLNMRVDDIEGAQNRKYKKGNQGIKTKGFFPELNSSILNSDYIHKKDDVKELIKF